jgi:outer membrane protein OmpA-like peptidoglycan-associated protein
MLRRANPDFRQLGLVSALIAAIPGALLAQDRPSAVLPPPSLYDAVQPPGTQADLVTPPRVSAAPAAPAPAAPTAAPSTPAPAPTSAAPAPAPRAATPAQSSDAPLAAGEPARPWYKRMWGTMTGWFGRNPSPEASDPTMVAVAPSSTSTPVTLSSPRASTSLAPTAGYAQDTPDRTIRTGVAGECLKTGMWEPSDVMTGCGAGQTVAKVEERAATPAAVSAESRVEPVEVQPLAVPALREEKSLEAEPVAAQPMPEPEPEPVAMPEPPQPQMTTLSADALFALGSHQLKPAAKAGLDEFASKLEPMEFDRITIVGHTDPTGKAAMNDKLSRQRAESVKRYLVARGIPADKIETDGVGSSMPMVIETDCARLPKAKKAACYQPDRRVEIEVQGASSHVAAQ